MKRLALFLLIAAVIGVGVFLLTPPAQAPDGTEADPAQSESLDGQELASVELSQERVEEIIAQVLGAEFNAETATHAVANLDGANGPELIIGAVENIADLYARPSGAVIQVVTVLNREGEYARIGQLQYQEWMRGAPEVKALHDLTGDGRAEIVMALMFGGASSWAEGILQVDTAEKKVSWLQLQPENGEPQDAIFILAASAAHSNTLEIRDVQKGGSTEIVEIFAQTLFDETQCSVNAYSWNGRLFAYNQVLSEEVFGQLTPACEFRPSRNM